MSRAAKRLVATFVALSLLAACAREVVETPAPEPAGPPNVVFIVGDGFGVGAWGLAREWAACLGRELVLDDPEAVGFLEVACAGELVTDSPAAATAWSTGRLSERRKVGETPSGRAPLLFERLRAADRAFGLVTTTRITHGTPAPFYARASDRALEDSLAVQLAPARPIVALGGGRRHFLPEAAGGARRDDRDLIREAEEAGFAVLDRFSAPLPVDRPVIGLFAPSHLPHEVDRGEDEPDLADLAVAAIIRLRAEGKPWFLMIEEGRIDHAGHYHDGPSVAFDSVRLDRCVGAVLNATDRSRTLVVVAADHGTSSPTFLETGHPESLAVVTASVEVMEDRIFGGEPWKGTPSQLERKALPVLDEAARQTGLLPVDLDRMVSAPDVHVRRVAIGKAISRRFGISFISFRDHLSSNRVHGHTSEPVPVRAWGPRAREVEGVHDHAELGRWLADVLALPADSAVVTAVAADDRPVAAETAAAD